MGSAFVEGFNTGSSISTRNRAMNLSERDQVMQEELHRYRMLEAARSEARKKRDDEDEDAIRQAGMPQSAPPAQEALSADRVAALSAAAQGAPSPQPATPAGPDMPAQLASSPTGAALSPMAPAAQPAAMPAAMPAAGGAMPVPAPAATQGAPLQDKAATLSQAAGTQQPEWVGSALERQANVAQQRGRIDYALKLREQLQQIKKSGMEDMMHDVMRGGDDASASRVLEDAGQTGAKVKVLQRYDWQSPYGNAIKTADLEVTRNGRTERINNVAATAYGIHVGSQEADKILYAVNRDKTRDAKDDRRADLQDAREERMTRAQEQSMRLQAAAAGRAASAADRAEKRAAWEQDFRERELALRYGPNGAGGAAAGATAMDTKDFRADAGRIDDRIVQDFPIIKDPITPEDQAKNERNAKGAQGLRSASIAALGEARRRNLPIPADMVYEAVRTAQANPDKVQFKTEESTEAGAPKEGTPFVMVGSYAVPVGSRQAIYSRDPGATTAGPPQGAMPQYAAGPPETLQKGNVPRTDMGAPPVAPEQRAGAVFADISARRRAQQAEAAQQKGRRYGAVTTYPVQ